MPNRVAGRYWPSRWRFSPAAGFFWQPCSFIVNKTATEESSYGVLSIVSNLISNAKTMSDALWVENDSSVPLLLVTSTIFKTFTPVFRSQQNCSAQKNYHTMYYPSYWFLAIKALFLTSIELAEDFSMVIYIR